MISHEWGKDRDYRLPTIVPHLNMLNYKTIKECRFSSNNQRVPILQQLSTNNFYMQVRNNTLNKNGNICSPLFFYVSFTWPPPLYRLVSHLAFYLLYSNICLVSNMCTFVLLFPRFVVSPWVFLFNVVVVWQGQNTAMFVVLIYDTFKSTLQYKTESCSTIGHQFKARSPVRLEWLYN